MKAALWFRRTHCSNYLIIEKFCTMHTPMVCASCPDFTKRYKPQEEISLHNRTYFLILDDLHCGPFTARYARWRFFRERFDGHAVMLQSRKHPTRFYRYENEQWEMLDLAKGVLNWVHMPSQFHCQREEHHNDDNELSAEQIENEINNDPEFKASLERGLKELKELKEGDPT